MWRVSILLVAAASIAAFAQATPQPVTTRSWRIPLTPCKAGESGVEAMCGNYEVFEVAITLICRWAVEEPRDSKPMC